MKEILCQTREIRKRETTLCCPSCGKFQYRVWGEGGITFQCERCKAVFEVNYANGHFFIQQLPEEKCRISRMREVSMA